MNTTGALPGADDGGMPQAGMGNVTIIGEEGRVGDGSNGTVIYPDIKAANVSENVPLQDVICIDYRSAPHCLKHRVLKWVWFHNCTPRMVLDIVMLCMLGVTIVIALLHLMT